MPEKLGCVGQRYCYLQATAVVRANLANHILVSHTTSSVAVMVRPPLVAPAQGIIHACIIILAATLHNCTYTSHHE